MIPKRSQFEIKTLFSVPPFTHLTLSVSFFFFSSLSLSHSQCNRHENELLICFPKEFLMPRRPDSRNTTVVVWSTNNFPGLHCLSKALFHRALIMWKMSLSKVSLLFFSHKDVRWRELEFPNMLIRVSVNSAPFLHSAREFIQHVRKFPVLEQHKCAFEFGCNMSPNWKGYRIMELRNSIGTICARTVLGTVVSQRRPRFHKEDKMTTCCVKMEMLNCYEMTVSLKWEQRRDSFVT